MAVHNPSVVFAAQINQVFSTHDDVTDIVFDGVTTGAYGDILPGMTLWVGSSAGSDDKGRARIRKAATSTVLSIGRLSEIDWEDNLHLTVVDEFGLWAKHWLVNSADDVYMDQDVAYSDQNTNCDPVPVMGPDAVLQLSGASVTLSPDGSDSWVPGSTISGYSWAVSGTGGSVANATTANPTFTFTAVGVFRISLTVTAANGKTKTGYRYVHVFGTGKSPVSDLVVRKVIGDVERGGWEFTVTLFDDAALNEIRDGAKVILFAEDWYGDNKVSVGELAGYENQICQGWIDGESIDDNPEDGGLVSFVVRGAAFWMQESGALPGGLKETSSTPDSWLYIEDLTVDLVLWHMITWRSTLSVITDCFPTGDTRQASALTSSGATLWDQFTEYCGKILAKPAQDRFNRVVFAIDPQLIPSSGRGTIPTIMSVTKNDWQMPISINRVTKPKISQLEISGVDAAGNPLFARSNGKIITRFGRAGSTKDRLLASDQDELNTMCGLLFSQENNEYPVVDLSLGSNNRMLDITPQYITLSVAAADNPRGVVWTDKKLIPRRVELSFNPKSGVMQTYTECEAETVEGLAVKVTPPNAETPGINVPPIEVGLPGYPLFPPGNLWWPGVVPPQPPVSGTCLAGENLTGPYQLWPDKFYLTSADAEKLSTAMYMKGVIRPGGVDYETFIMLDADIQYKVGGVWYNSTSPVAWILRATDAEGNVVQNGINDWNAQSPIFSIHNISRQYVTWFKPISATEFSGFELEVYQPAAGSVYNQSFDFSTGTQGWYPPEQSGVGWTDQASQWPINGRTPYDPGYFKWNAGYLGLASNTPGESDRVVNCWIYKPMNVYTAEGATFQATFVENNSFSGFGVKCTDGSWLFGYANNGVQTRTFSAGEAGKKIYCFAFHAGDMAGQWNTMDNVVLTGFAQDDAEYRIRINKILLYDVCRSS